MKWFVVVNPLAGGGSAGSKWNSVREILLNRGISFDYLVTGGPENTRSITKKALLSGYRGIAVYGGDGTLSDTASMGFTALTVDEAVSAMISERFRIVDTAVARWNHMERFFLNSSGTGFDALVLKRAIKLRKRLPLNKTCYWMSLLFSALLPPAWQGEFSCDGRVFHKGGYLTFTSGVGTYSGGGMRLSPGAVPDDGKLDGLCLTPMNFVSIALNLGRVFDGRLGETKWARGARGSVLTLETLNNSPLLLELDGEPVDIQGAAALELVSVPESLRVPAP